MKSKENNMNLILSTPTVLSQKTHADIYLEVSAWTCAGLDSTEPCALLITHMYSPLSLSLNSGIKRLPPFSPDVKLSARNFPFFFHWTLNGSSPVILHGIIKDWPIGIRISGLGKRINLGF